MTNEPVEVPSLDALASDLSLINTLPPETAKALCLGLLVLEKALMMRALMGASNGQVEGELLTIPEVAKRLKVSEYRAYELARQGVLKSVRLGKSVRVKPEDLAAYVAEQGA